MAVSNLRAVLTAQDSGGTAGISKFGDAVNKLGSNVDSANKKASDSGASFGKLSTSVGVGIAAYQALSSTLQRVTNFFGSSIKAANDYQSAMLGLSTVSQSFGVNAAEATQAAKQLASDGLLTVNEAGTALKNLIATGFSLPQAIKLMTQFKDIAAFNRQGTLEFGQAIVGATIGIKNGNSILVDNIGLTKNLSLILREAGFSEQDLMRATSDSNVRMALYNGLLKETVAFSGDAAKLAHTFAGAQAAAGVQVDYLKQNVGNLLQVIGAPLLSTFTKFISNNREMVASLSVAGVGVLIFGTAILGLVKIGSVVVSAIQAMTLTTGVLGIALLAISAVLGGVLYNAFNKMQGKVAEQNKKLMENSDGSKKAMTGSNSLGKAQEELADKIQKVNDQIIKENRNFQESLAEMVKSHQDKVKKLGDQIQQENKDFAEAQQEKANDFKATNEEAITNHQDKVNKIQQQINEEASQGRFANQQKLQDLRAEMDKENSEFAKQQAKKEADYQQEQAKDKEQHDKKLTEIQTELDAETQLLQKHAADVAAVRDVQLLDEIDKLKRSHQDQLIAYDEQKRDILKKSGETAQGVVDAFAGTTGEMASTGQNLGNALGSSMKQAFIESFKDVGRTIVIYGEAIAQTIVDMGKNVLSFILHGRGDNKGFTAKLQDNLKYFENLNKRASGGPVLSSTPYIVGEQGPELFIPSTSGKIISNNKLPTQSTQKPINITIQAGAFMGSQQDARKYAMMIMGAYNDAMAARGIV